MAKCQHKGRGVGTEGAVLAELEASTHSLRDNERNGGYELRLVKFPLHRRARQSLVSYLQDRPCIERVYFHNCSAKSRYTAFELLHDILTKTRVARLAFAGILVNNKPLKGRDVLRALCSVIDGIEYEKNEIHVSELVLDYISMHPDDFDSLCYVLSEIPVSYLSLNQCDLTDTHMLEFVNGLMEYFESCPNRTLKHLDVSFNPEMDGPNVLHFARTLGLCSTLETLKMDYCGLSDARFCDVLWHMKDNPHLRHLSLALNNVRGKSATDSTVLFLERSNVVQLNLGGNYIHGGPLLMQRISNALHRNAKLRVLDLTTSEYLDETEGMEDYILTEETMCAFKELLETRRPPMTRVSLTPHPSVREEYTRLTSPRI